MNEEESLIDILLNTIANNNLNYLEINNIKIFYNGKKPKGTFNNTTGATEYEEFVIRRDVING